MRSRLKIAATLALGLATAPAAAPAYAAAPPADLVGPILAISYFAPLSGVTLTADQTTRITQIELAVWKQVLPQIVALVTAHETIIGELVKAAPNTVTIRSQEQKKLQALQRLDLLQLQAWAKIHPLLSGDQLAQASTAHQATVADLIAWYNANFPH